MSVKGTKEKLELTLTARIIRELRWGSGLSADSKKIENLMMFIKPILPS
jgi:hypothetical protein